jgi:hypothetical protein
MLYTHLGRIAAVLGLLVGILMIYHSWSRLWVIQSVEPYDVERANFVSQQFYTGILIVLVAIGVGTLTDISRSVRANITNTPARVSPISDNGKDTS